MRSLLIITLAFFCTGCYDLSFGSPEEGGATIPATTTIRKLCDLFVGPTITVTGDIVIAGRVTANDRGDNFYRTLCIEQEGAGIELRAAVDRLHNDFPVGCHVTLRLRGLALGRSYGVLQVGATPAAGSGYATDYIPSKPALDAVLSRGAGKPEPIVPAVKTLPELTTALCGTLIRIENLHYTPEEITVGTWAGYKRFTDAGGVEIHTYVREWAGFADKEVPAGKVSLTGILQYDDTGDGRFILKPRDEGDWVY